LEIKLNEMSRTKEGDVVEIEGKVNYTAIPRSGQYGWSQWIVIKEGKDEQGCWVYLEQDEEGNCLDKIIKGAYIKLKGTVKEFTNKKNQPDKSVNGKVIDEIVKVENVSKEKPISQPISQQNTVEKTVEKEYTNNDYWYDKTLREIENNKCIVRECAIKAVSEQVARNNPFAINDKTMFFGFADEIVDYIYDKGITSETITKEFGGTTTELIVGTKEERIAKVKEIANPNMATKPQKDMVEKIINSRYIEKDELEKIGGKESESFEEARIIALENINQITKVNANRYISYWFGDGVKVGERAERELIAKEEEEQNPFATERQPLEKVDKNDDTSLTKDVLIDKINKLRKENSLEDDAKFTKELGYNTNFKLWNEKELTKLKEKLEIYKPNWMTGK